MIANLLLVSTDEFPNVISRELERSGFSCSYSRGVIKTREILDKQEIDTIVWIFMGHETALAKDLLSVFNLHARIPIVFITQTYDELEFAEDIKALFANHDINDDLSDIIETVETACNQSIIKDQEQVSNETVEIEFKNAVSQILRKPISVEPEKEIETDRGFSRVDLWDAVDKAEKDILSGRQNEMNREKPKPRRGLFKKF